MSFDWLYCPEYIVLQSLHRCHLKQVNSTLYHMAFKIWRCQSFPHNICNFNKDQYLCTRTGLVSSAWLFCESPCIDFVSMAVTLTLTQFAAYIYMEVNVNIKWPMLYSVTIFTYVNTGQTKLMPQIFSTAESTPLAPSFNMKLSNSQGHISL